MDTGREEEKGVAVQQKPGNVLSNKATAKHPKGMKTHPDDKGASLAAQIVFVNSRWRWFFKIKIVSPELFYLYTINTGFV